MVILQGKFWHVRFAIFPTMVKNLFMRSSTYFSYVIFLTFRTFNIDCFLLCLWSNFVYSLIWKLEPSFVVVCTTFVSMLVSRELCKAILKDLITFSPCCLLYSHVINGNCFLDNWLLFLFIKLFSLLVLLLLLLLLFIFSYSCCFSTCFNICIIIPQR